MNCRNTDHDLLFLAHGELSYARRIMVQQHVRSCPRCQERLAQLTAASYQIAAAIREPHMPAWRPRVYPPWTAPLKDAPVVIALMVTISIAIGIAVTKSTSFSHGCSASVIRSVPGNKVDQPCRPGLPSDRCR